MKQVPASLWLALASAALASGCARAVVSTTVKTDGSWTRTIRFQADQLSRLQETFALPTGAPWATRKDWVDKQAIYTAGRTLRSGETLSRDIVVAKRAETQ